MVDWQALVEPHHLVENVIRASVIYWMLFLILRFLPNRKTGGMGTSDLLVVVLLANAVQTAMMRDSTALSDAVVQVATIVGWSTLLDIVTSRVPFLRPVIQSEPVEVVRDGAILQRNLRREFMTEEELKAQLRLQGVESVEQVRRASIEQDGRVSVIRTDRSAPNRPSGRAAISGR
jgi:uncharacterized membrane protein YcaP (DUF421 family)